ncbi:hypothetical protein D3C85_1234850 [compost metagenome]
MLSSRPLAMVVPLAPLKLARALVPVPEQFFSSMAKSVSPVVSPALARFSARASPSTTVAGLGVATPLTEMSQVLPSTEPLKWMTLVVGEARAAWLAAATRAARVSFLIMLDVLLVRISLLGLHREAWPPVSGDDGPGNTRPGSAEQRRPLQWSLEFGGVDGAGGRWIRPLRGRNSLQAFSVAARHGMGDSWKAILGWNRCDCSQIARLPWGRNRIGGVEFSAMEPGPGRS